MSAEEKLKKIEEYLTKKDIEVEQMNNDIGSYDYYESGIVVGACGVICDIQEIIKGVG